MKNAPSSNALVGVAYALAIECLALLVFLDLWDALR